MATATAYPETLNHLVHYLGNIPLERIRMRPPPGTATEEDLLASLTGPGKRLCELVNGVLVEKPMGTKEGLLAGLILHEIWNYLERHDLGIALPGDSAVRLKIGLVRIPDVCFISWRRLPHGELPGDTIAEIVPDLAVEVLSEGNTSEEMERKLREYFQAGVRLVWIVDPKTRTAEIYTTPLRKRRIGSHQSLTGGKVLPGFSLLLKDLFLRMRRKKA